jgi:hypothetical protein
MIRSRSGRREFPGALGDKRKKLAKMSGHEPPVHAGGFLQLSHGIVLCVIASGAARQLLLKVVVECFTYCHQLASGHLLDMRMYACRGPDWVSALASPLFGLLFYQRDQIAGGQNEST